MRSPANILPRANAPDWAVKPMYRQSVTSPTNGDQQLASTPVSSTDARPMSSCQLSFREMPDKTVTSSSDSECDLELL